MALASFLSHAWFENACVTTQRLFQIKKYDEGPVKLLYNSSSINIYIKQFSRELGDT